MRIDYAKVNSRAVNMLLSAKKHISLIDDRLKALLETRVSQINGCAYCVDLHITEAIGLGEAQQRLDCLTVWKESGLFSEKEMAAIDWAESVTNISSESDIEGKLDSLLQHFSEAEVVDLTLIVALMNSLNRLAISFGSKPPKRHS